jgi:hypothetical protein
MNFMAERMRAKKKVERSLTGGEGKKVKTKEIEAIHDASPTTIALVELRTR